MDIKDFAITCYKYLSPIVEKIKKKFRNLEEEILYLDWKVTFEEYLALMIFSVIFSFVFIFIFSLTLMYILYGIITPPLVLLSLAYAGGVSLMVFFYFYYYPKLAKSDYIKEIDDNLPLFLIYFYGLISAGLTPTEAFKIAARRKEFGKLSKDIRFIVYLIEVLGYDFLSAIMIAAKKTPSYKFKEFLYELFSAVRSGGSIRELVRAIAREALADYEIRLKAYIDRLNFYLTLYTFIFITFPLLLLVIVFIMSLLAGTPQFLYGLIIFFLFFIPLSYVAYLYMLYITQPAL